MPNSLSDNAFNLSAKTSSLSSPVDAEKSGAVFFAPKADALEVRRKQPR